ncbi:hypothetical protein BHM03_00027659 [Ensete ventricosum]|nr:hypothetical protein BHM03_00027659 [Ensete ventricosum]
MEAWLPQRRWPPRSYAQSSRTVPHHYHLKHKPLTISAATWTSHPLSPTVEVYYSYPSFGLQVAVSCWRRRRRRRRRSCMKGNKFTFSCSGKADMRLKSGASYSSMDGVGVGREVPARDAMAGGLQEAPELEPAPASMHQHEVKMPFRHLLHSLLFPS